MSTRHALLLALLPCCAQAAPFRVERITDTSSGTVQLSLADDEESALVSLDDQSPCGSSRLRLFDDGPALAVLTDARQIALTVEPAGPPITVLRKKRNKRVRQQIDLNLFVTSGTGFERGAAERNSHLRAIRERAASILAQANIVIGEVRFFYPQSAVGAVSYVDCMPASAHAVWSEQPRDVPLGINVLLVNAIEVPTTHHAVGGFSPVPGAGQMRDGIVLTLNAFDAEPSWGDVLAHEIGHYLGLFHVLEPNGTTLDPIEDTPKSDPEALGNLMRWEGVGTTLTPGQIARMRLHPLVY